MLKVNEIRRLLFLLICALFALVWPAVASQKFEVSDDAIYDQVRRRLANDPDVKGGTLGVEVKEGVVTLRGTVEKEKLKQKAEKLTKKVPGVKRVINELKIEPVRTS